MKAKFSENREREDFDNRKGGDKNFKKKKSPKHGKMGPAKKDKYRNWGDDY